MMSGVHSQGPVDIVQDNTVSESVDTSQPNAPHGEHEAPKKLVQDTRVDEPAAPAEEDGDSRTNDTEPPQSDDFPTIDDAASLPAADEEKKEEPASTTNSGKSKPAMSVKVSDDKSAGPPTPLVKKVSPAGQFLLLP
jgi:hypothetical protein